MSEYGDRSLNPERTARVLSDDPADLEASVARNRSLHAHLPSYLIDSQAIKPTTSFLNLTRDQMVFNDYVDL